MYKQLGNYGIYTHLAEKHTKPLLLLCCVVVGQEIGVLRSAPNLLYSVILSGT